MNDRIEALILRIDPYKESDGLIQVLTKEQGKLTVLAKGIMKGSSKNAHAVQPITHCSMIVDLKESISLLHTASIIEYFRPIKEDIVKLAVASLIVEIAAQVSSADQPDEFLFEITKDSLSALCRYPALQIGSLYISQILREMGISPMVDGCVVCDDSKVIGISIAEGGFTCQRCSKYTASKYYEAGFNRVFRHIVKAQLKHAGTLAGQGDVSLQLLSVFVDFFKEYTSIPLKSWEFLRNL